MMPLISYRSGRARRAASLAAGLLAAASVACVAPPEHFTRLWPGGRSGAPVLGLSTEEGVIVLGEPQYAVGDVFEIQFPIGNSVVSAHGSIVRLNEELALVEPADAILREGRFADGLPDFATEDVFVALRDEDDRPVMRPVTLWHDGTFGDWVVIDDIGDADAFARDHAGVGLYVYRQRYWQIVGMLAGITARSPDLDDDDVGLGYISLLEMARLLPDRIDYFEHGVKPLRPDFEFGVPLQPGDVDLPEPQPDPSAAPPSDAP
ncbi:MAG: hypothetical protein H6825_14640 [Planctomycetes bacterium]|nr:hypothetical protein [Planctomycetota bacterium]